MFYKFIKVILLFILFFIVKVEINNLDKLPKKGSLVIASNHLSMWDPVIIGTALPRKLHFMAKEELFKVFLLGGLMKRIGTFPVKRGSADRNAIKEALKILGNNEVLCIFPEGTRSKTGEISEFHPGGTMIAYKGDAPILPVGITGTDKILKNGIKKTKVVVNIGDPLYIEKNDQGKITSEQLSKVTQALHEKVRNLV